MPLKPIIAGNGFYLSSTGASFANPTASLGLTAVNGSASTAMRSDAAPALDVTIAPTWTGAHTFAPSSAATPITLTGGTVTTALPVLNATQTWNNVATSFTGIKLNITDTASASGSLLMDLQVGSSSKCKIDKTGIITSAASSFFLTGGTYGFSIYNISGGYWCIARADQAGGTQTFEWHGGNTNGNIRGDFGIGTAMASADTVLSRRAAKVLGIVNSISGSSSAGNAFSLGSQTVSQLTAAATAGQGAMAYVTDATSTTAGSNVAGGGSNKALVVSDGTNWKIVVGF